VGPWTHGGCHCTGHLEACSPGLRRRRTVHDGLAGNSWAGDISGELSVDAVVQYLRLWAVIQDMNASRGGGQDSFAWKWHEDGRFSSKSPYRAQLHGTVGLPGAPLIWHSFAPLRFKMHAWLALRRHCWTADKRLRRGLPSHTRYALSMTPLMTHSTTSPYTAVLPKGFGVGSWWLWACQASRGRLA
jgi:hypothetical protein